jgi:hypothetical protein
MSFTSVLCLRSKYRYRKWNNKSVKVEYLVTFDKFVIMTKVMNVKAKDEIADNTLTFGISFS